MRKTEATETIGAAGVLDEVSVTELRHHPTGGRTGKGRPLAAGWLAGLLMALSAPCSPTANAATLQSGPWPQAQACRHCLRVQFWRLELQLPPNEVGKLFYTGSGDLGLDLVPLSGDLLRSTSLMSRSYRDLQAQYRKSGFLELHGIRSVSEYLDTLGREPAAGDGRLELLRRLTFIDTAVSYTRRSAGELTAYVVQGADADQQLIWFVIEGDDTYYELAGPMSPALVDAVLAHARVVAVP